MTFLPICWYADIGDCQYADIADNLSIYIAYISVSKPTPWAVAGPIGSWRVQNFLVVKDLKQHLHLYSIFFHSFAYTCIIFSLFFRKYSWPTLLFISIWVSHYLGYFLYLQQLSCTYFWIEGFFDDYSTFYQAPLHVLLAPLTFLSKTSLKRPQNEAFLSKLWVLPIISTWYVW